MSTTTAAESLTHHVRLILDNDEGLYLTRREIVAENAATPHDVANRLRELYESLVGLNDEFGVEMPNMAAMEVLSTALAFVDWHGMALDYIEEEGE